MVKNTGNAKDTKIEPTGLLVKYSQTVIGSKTIVASLELENVLIYCHSKRLNVGKEYIMNSLTETLLKRVIMSIVGK